MRTTKKYKSCVVPICKSNTKKNPEKLFFALPKDDNLRQKWFRAMRRDIHLKISKFCCEDHFNLEQDMENYIRYKYKGDAINLKKDVVPHIFECQGRIPKKKDGEKRKRLRILNDLLANVAKVSKTSQKENQNMESEFVDCGSPSSVSKGIKIPKKKFADKAIQVNIKPRMRSRGTNTIRCFEENLVWQSIQESFRSHNTIPIKQEDISAEEEILGTSFTKDETANSSTVPIKHEITEALCISPEEIQGTSVIKDEIVYNQYIPQVKEEVMETHSILIIKEEIAIENDIIGNIDT